MTVPAYRTIATRGHLWLARTSTLVIVHLVVGVVVFLRPFGESNSPVGEALYVLGPPAMVAYSGILIYSLSHAHRLPAIRREESIVLFPYAIRRHGVREEDIKVRRIVRRPSFTIVLFAATERRPRFLSIAARQVVDDAAFDALVERLQAQLNDRDA